MAPSARTLQRLAALVMSLIFALTLTFEQSEGRAYAASGGCGTVDTPSGGIGSVYVSFYGCTSIASRTTINLLPHSAVGAGPTSCDEVATIYENGSEIGTRNMACNLNGSPATVITVTPGATYTFTWYMYLVVHGVAYYSTVDSSPAINLPIGTCSTHACQVDVNDADVADENAQKIQFTIEVPTAPQKFVDAAGSVGWVFVQLNNRYEFQAGFWFGNGCPAGEALPFTQWYSPNAAGVETYRGQTLDTKHCGITGAHTFDIDAVGLNSQHFEQFEAYMDNSPMLDSNGKPTAIMTDKSTVTTTGNNLPYAGAELTSNTVDPSGSDTMGPFRFDEAFQSLPPPGTGSWHSSTSATSASYYTICPPFTLFGEGANGFAAGSVTPATCIPDGTRIW